VNNQKTTHTDALFVGKYAGAHRLMFSSQCSVRKRPLTAVPAPTRQHRGISLQIARFPSTPFQYGSCIYSTISTCGLRRFYLITFNQTESYETGP
ncbi:hypothetical protein J6590_063317, partial [Homalodisca vitripennis]